MEKEKKPYELNIITLKEFKEIDFGEKPEKKKCPSCGEELKDNCYHRATKFGAVYYCGCKDLHLTKDLKEIKKVWYENGKRKTWLDLDESDRMGHGMYYKK